MTTTLALGQFVFKDFQIPESIGFGGEQKLSVKRLVGGAKVVDSLGYDPSAPAWSGVFFGNNAMNDATTLKAMMQGGKSYPLDWDALSYTVVIQSLKLDFRKPFYIPYSIVCEVVTDKSQQVDYRELGVNGAIMEDAGTASDLVDQISSPPLTLSMASLTTAIGKVSDFAKATQSTVNSVLAPLATVQAQANLLIASTEKTLSNVATVGGLLPNNPIAKNVAQLGNYVAAAQSSPLLVRLSSVLGRIGTNIGQINSSVRVVTVPGGNLLDIASKQYGDAMGWTAIAAANPALKGETQLSGVTTLTIPPYLNQTGGVSA